MNEIWFSGNRPHRVRVELLAKTVALINGKRVKKMTGENEFHVRLVSSSLSVD